MTPDPSSPQRESREQAAIDKMFDAWQALRLLGWVEPRYFKYPPDGEEFELIEIGSTGIHTATRNNGYIYVDHEWPVDPTLVRSKK